MADAAGSPPRRRSARLERVAEGVHRLAHAGVNCYLLVDGGRVTVVDAALPRTWPPFRRALAALGLAEDAVEAVVLTHAHFDHVGFARSAQRELGAPVFAHGREHRLAAHPYSYAHERPRAVYPLRYPAALPTLAAMARAGALRVRGVTGLRPLEPGTRLDVPGAPEVLFTPGHTFGHCALHLPDRGVLLTGDALVTLDPYTGRRGPRIVAGAATADSAAALRSLEAIRATDAALLLPGHGDPWRHGAAYAVALALEAGAA